jgi:uncharacterized DUF497 family protein
LNASNIRSISQEPGRDGIRVERRQGRANTAIHGVTFEEAQEVFGDPLALTFDDVEHSADEPRYLTFGLSASGRPVVVAHTARGATIRIISARQMTPRERRHYEQ